MLLCLFEANYSRAKTSVAAGDLYSAVGIARPPPQAHNFGMVRRSRFGELGGQPDFAMSFEEAACLRSLIQKIGKYECCIKNAPFAFQLRKSCAVAMFEFGMQ